MITFKAHFINNTTVQRKKNNKQFENVNVSFVQLNPKSANDIKALYEIDKEWWSFKTYANDIRLDFLNDYEPSAKTYAVTTQKDHFEKLNPDEVLGLAYVVDETAQDRVILEYLQADPSNKHAAAMATFKRIGSSIIKSLSKIYENNEMILTPKKTAEPFYEKLGFKWNSAGLLTKKL